MSVEVGHLELHEALQALLRSRRPFACLAGAQSSGKTIYAQYLERCFSRDDHAWSLGPLFRAATHDLRLNQPALIGETDIAGLSAKAAAGQQVVTLDTSENRAVSKEAEKLRRYSHAPGTKSIKHLTTAAERKARQGRRREHALGLDFIDVPGEWARAYASSGQADELLHVLDRTGVFVLFVPVWSLFSRTLVEAALAGPEGERAQRLLASTSAHKNSVAEAFGGAHEDTVSWVDRLEDAAGSREIHVLVVLSQFQEDVVRGLCDLTVEATRGAEGLGDWWDRLDATLGLQAEPVGFGERAIPELAHHLSACRSICVEMLAHLSRVPGAGDGIAALDRLLDFRGGLQNRATRDARKRLLSVDVMPLNVVRLSEQAPLPSREEALAQQRGRQREGPDIVDHRMCYDVLCWLLMQLHGGEIWPC